MRLRWSRRSNRLDNPPEPRFQRLLEAAFACRGDMAAVQRRLQVAPKIVIHQLSLMRRGGLARTVTLFDPHKIGRPLEVIAWLRLSDYTPAAICAIEAWIAGDPAVTHAVCLTGSADYRLSCAFSDIRSADAWARACVRRPAVAHIRLDRVRTLWGSAVDGVLLWGGGPD